MSYLVTSGYTIGSPYYNAVLALYESGQKHGVHVEAMPYNTFGTWRANVNYKALLAEYALKRQGNNGVNIVWIDAGGLILKPLTLFDDYPYDIGVYIAEWPLGSGKRVCDIGTVFFKNCPKVLEFVKKWAVWSMAHQTKSLQDEFCKMMKASSLNWAELPPEYCMVVAPDPVPDNFKPYITKPGPIRDDISMEDIVIKHVWGSRTHGKEQKFK